ncbi:LacI family DNA-binding transcriptional regulator [Arthrobacter sp. MI7-26]|uniref:LacI family DNA-binding transcriptional regulator n=1 Tax=Arthrobacter sp. MI7-26 TaxID=2993653 RepID=UPI0022487BB1|nr:LacI family DNA-binding transcriptional regulator [Arthrobacter sp. MI7-26]MCX2750025.1 LacI family DNA-binding transcriptional regulator [Arthrobacter sp. MI7-26]
MEVNRSSMTLKDVARLAGVHPATASRALDPARRDLVRVETRERVVRVAEEVGYRLNTLAQGLRKNVTGMVGIVVADVANPFVPPLLRGVEEVLREQKTLSLIAETHEHSGNLKRILDQLIARRADAIILCAAHESDYQTVMKAATAIPLVLAVRTVGGPWPFPAVTHDDFLGAQLATRHLVTLGHPRIAQIQGPHDVSSFVRRSAGYSSVLSRSVARDVSIRDQARSPSVEEGQRLAALILSQSTPDRPTAIFAHNDLMALGALKAIAEKGLACPADVSLVGYNDQPLIEHISPPLTSVRLPSLELGQQAATLALGLVKGGGNLNQVVQRISPPKLVLRESTARPRAHLESGSES